MSDLAFDEGMRRIEELVEQLEATCSPETLPLVRDLVSVLLDVHRIGLGELCTAWGGAETAAGGLASLLRSNPALESLLLMHELHPESRAARVARAVREANDAAGGRAQASVVSTNGANAVVSVTGAAASAELLGKAVERLVCEYAPDATLRLDVAVDAPAPPALRLVPVERLTAGIGSARR